MHRFMHTCENVRLCECVTDASASDFFEVGKSIFSTSRFFSKATYAALLFAISSFSTNARRHWIAPSAL